MVFSFLGFVVRFLESVSVEEQAGRRRLALFLLLLSGKTKARGDWGWCIRGRVGGKIDRAGRAFERERVSVSDLQQKGSQKEAGQDYRRERSKQSKAKQVKIRSTKQLPACEQLLNCRCRGISKAARGEGGEGRDVIVEQRGANACEKAAPAQPVIAGGAVEIEAAGVVQAVAATRRWC